MTRETGGEREVLFGEQVLSEELCLQGLFEGRVWPQWTMGGMGSNKIVQIRGSRSSCCSADQHK